MKSLNNSTKIKIIYFLKFFADALFCGYMSMYFATFFSNNSLEYGILLGVIPFCSLIGNAIWGALSKDIKKNLMLAKIVMALETLGMVLFTFVGSNFITLLIFTIFVSLFNSPYFTLQDGLGSFYSKKDDTSYISVRVKGSMGYLFALIVGAGLIKLFNENYRIIFLISASLNVVCFMVWNFVSKIKDVENTQEIEKIKFSEVLKNKTFILYFIAYLLIIGSNNVGDTYLYARLSLNDIEPSMYSLVVALEVLLEVLVMLGILKFIKEKHYFTILKISIVFMCLRSFFLGMNISLPYLMVFASFRGIGWGGFIAVHLIVLRKIVSSNLVVKAISLLTIALSLLNGVFTICGTSIYSAISLPYFYLLLSMLTLIGIIIMINIKPSFMNEGDGKHEN